MSAKTKAPPSRKAAILDAIGVMIEATGEALVSAQALDAAGVNHVDVRTHLPGVDTAQYQDPARGGYVIYRRDGRPQVLGGI